MIIMTMMTGAWTSHRKEVYFACALFLQVIFIVMTCITRDTLFMSQYGKDKLPYALLATSLVSMPALRLCGRLLERFPSYIVAATFAIVMSASYFALFIFISTESSYGLEASKGGLAYAFFYVWSDICVGLSTTHFWDVCNSAFAISESKTAFGHINMGSTVGNIFIGFILVGALNAYEVPTRMNLVFLSFLALCNAFAFFFSGGMIVVTAGRPSELSGGNESKSVASAHSSIRNLSPYILHLCLFEICATVVRVFIDLQMLSVLDGLPEAVIGSNLGLISGMQSVIMLPLQAVTGWILSKFGVLYGLSIAPFSTILFGALTSSLGGIYPVVISRSVFNAVTYTVFTTSRELLWLPVAEGERKSLKPFVTGTVRSLARGAGAIISISLRGRKNNRNVLGMVIASVGTLWLLDVLWARREYAREFYRLLKRMGGGAGKKMLSERRDVRHLDLTDPNVIDVVRQTLRRGTEVQRIFTLDALPYAAVKNFRMEVLGLMNHTGIPDHRTPSMRSDSIGGNGQRLSPPLPVSPRKKNRHYRNSTTGAQTPPHSSTRDAPFASPISAPPSPADSRQNFQGKGGSIRRDENADELLLGKMDQPSSMYIAIRIKALQLACHAGIATANDILLLVCDPDLERQMKIEALKLCATLKMSNPPLLRKLEAIVSASIEKRVPRTIRVCAAIALLRITNWMHTKSHVLLHSMLHHRGDMKSQVAALTLLGEQMPELISDGFLVYVLNTYEHEQRLQLAAIRSCSIARRRSPILLPSLVSKLGDAGLRQSACDALAYFEPQSVIDAVEGQLSTTFDVEMINGCVHCIEQTRGVPPAVKVSILVDCCLTVANDAVELKNTRAQYGNLSRLRPVVEYIAHLSPAIRGSLRQRIVELATGMAKQISHFAQTDVEGALSTLPSHAYEKWVEIMDVRRSLASNVLIAMKLCASVLFPATISVELLLEMMSSESQEMRAAAFEVVQNLVDGSRRSVFMPMLRLWTQIDAKIVQGFSSARERALETISGRASLSETQIVLCLSNSKVFHGVPIERLKIIARHATQQYYSRGEIVSEEHAPMEREELKILAHGKVGLHFAGSRDKPALTLGPGQCLSEESLCGVFLENMAIHCGVISARAEEQCIVVSIRQRELRYLMNQIPALVVDVMQVLLMELRACYMHRLYNASEEEEALNMHFEKHRSNTPNPDVSQSESKSVTKNLLRRGYSHQPEHGSRMTFLEKCICIQDSPVFAALSHDDICSLAETSSELSLEPGEVLFQLGDSANFIFLIVEGSCSFSNDAMGLLGRIDKGSVSGTLALLPNSSRLFSCHVADSSFASTVILVFDSAKILQLSSNITGSLARHAAGTLLSQLQNLKWQYSKSRDSGSDTHPLGQVVEQNQIFDAGQSAGLQEQGKSTQLVGGLERMGRAESAGENTSSKVGDEAFARAVWGMRRRTSNKLYM
eukprot:g4515.t1